MWSLFRLKPRQTKPIRRTPPSIRPRLEALEDRCLMSAGALDPTFGSGGVVTTSLSKYKDYADAVLVQPNGKIVEVGQAGTSTGGELALVRYNANGTLDSTFGRGGIVTSKIGGGAYAALEPGITDTNGNEAIVEASYGTTVALFNPNGSLDTSFGNKGTVTAPYDISGVVVQQVGTSYDIVVAGDGTTNSVFKLTRFTSSGALDTSFGSNGTATLSIPGGVLPLSVALQSDGKLVVGGLAGSGPNGTAFDVARFTANGQLDTTFGGGTGYVSGSFTTSGVTDNVFQLFLASYPSTGADTTDANKIVAVCQINGNTGGTNGSQVGLARFNPDGSPDSTFGQLGVVVTPFPNSGAQAWATALQGDGKIVVAGDTFSNGNTNFSLLRYNTDGSLDTTFSNSYGQQIFPNGGLVVTPSGPAYSRAWAVAIQPDGSIVAAGQVQVAAGSNDYNFMTVRYLASEPEIGSFTTSPNPVTTGSSATLTASNITDGNPNSTITQVTFYYYDSSGTQQVLGYGTPDGQGDWTLTFTVTLAPGTYTLFSQAEDGYGVFGDPKALTLTVQ